MLGHPNPHAPPRIGGPRPHPPVQRTHHDVRTSPIALTVECKHAPLSLRGLTPSAFDVSSKRPHTRTVLPHPQRRFQGLTSKVNATHDFFRRTPHGPTPNASLAGLSLDSNVPIPLTLASNPRLDQPATLGMLPRRKGSPLTFSQSCPSFVHPLGNPVVSLGPSNRGTQEPSLLGGPSTGQLPVEVVFLRRPIHTQSQRLTFCISRQRPRRMAPPTRHPAYVISSCSDAMRPNQPTMLQGDATQRSLKLGVVQPPRGLGQLHFRSSDKEGQSKCIRTRKGQPMTPPHLVAAHCPSPRFRMARP